METPANAIGGREWRTLITLSHRMEKDAQTIAECLRVYMVSLQVSECVCVSNFHITVLLVIRFLIGSC